jgi:Transposase DDE domain
MLFMCINDLLLETFCWVDDEIKALVGGRLRQRGPAPTLAESEVITMELVGEYLGRDQDKQLFEYFNRYHQEEFPHLAQVDRTTFVRQAANLWRVKAELCRRWSSQLLGQNRCWLIDSLPVAVCQFARAKHCHRFEGVADFGKTGCRGGGTYYGFRLHLRTSPEGIISQVGLAPASVSDLAMTEEILPPEGGLSLGDRNYWSPDKQAALAQRGWQLLAPFRHASRDPAPEHSRVLGRARQRIETTLSQLTERFHIKRIWARDLWHLANRLYRKVLSHLLMVRFNVCAGLPPLHLADLLTN